MVKDEQVAQVRKWKKKTKRQRKREAQKKKRLYGPPAHVYDKVSEASQKWFWQHTDHSYREYLKTQWWKFFRQQCRRNLPFKCIVCGETKGLELHHKRYRRFREEFKDVEWRCHVCHRDAHQDKCLPIDDVSKQFRQMFG
jgi:hypothetical protein